MTVTPPGRRSRQEFAVALAIGVAAAATPACGPADPVGPDARASLDAGPVAQGGPPGGALAIGEVAPDPSHGPDWIELLNRGAQPIDLCAYFVTDLADRLDHFHPLGGALPPDPCAPRLLGPGERSIVYADDRAEPGVDHAGFALADADEVHVIDADGRVVDGLRYLLPDGHHGRSLARIPDGEGPFYLVEPTPGEPNPEAP